MLIFAHRTTPTFWRRLAAAMSGTVAVFFLMAQTAARIDLTGEWRSNSGGVYLIEQHGDHIVWEAHAPDGHSWTHRFEGTISGDILSGEFHDHPPGGLNNGGPLVFQISHDRLTRTNQTRAFGDTTLTLVGPLGPQGIAAAPTAGSYWLPPEAALATFAQALDKACAAPADYRQFRQGLATSGGGFNGAVNGFVSGGRSGSQKFETDLRIYDAYYPAACPRAERLHRCIGRALTAEEACDCAAGEPGDVTTGIGAGELISGAYVQQAVQACGEAASRATGLTRARYIAQKGRAQTYTFDAHQARVWLDEAIAAGYAKAQIDIARIYLHDLPILGSSFPPMTQDQADTAFRDAAKHISLARAAGARETGIVADALIDQMNIMKFNSAVTTGLLRSSAGAPTANDPAFSRYARCNSPGATDPNCR